MSLNDEQLIAWLVGLGRYVQLEDIAEYFSVSMEQVQNTLQSMRDMGVRFREQTYRDGQNWCKAVCLKAMPISRDSPRIRLARARAASEPSCVHHYWQELLRKRLPFRHGS